MSARGKAFWLCGLLLPAFLGAWAGEFEPPPRPDLIAIIRFPSQPSRPSDFLDRLKTLVKNKGTAEASNFYVDIVLHKRKKHRTLPEEPILCGRGFVSSVGAGGSAVPAGLHVSFPPGMAPGEYDLCAVVDPDGTVEELDENNNSACQRLSISKAFLSQKRRPR